MKLVQKSNAKVIYLEETMKLLDLACKKSKSTCFLIKLSQKKQSLDIKQFIESISNTKIKINIEHFVMNTFENLVKEHSINYGPEDLIKFILKWGGDGSNVKEKQFRGDSVGFSDNL